jgi:N-6 DNA Methylase
LPPDLLARIAAGQVDGLDPQRDYHLAPNERLNEAISRSWNRLQAAWTSYKDLLSKLPLGGSATTETRERWLLVLFQELGFGRLQPARTLEVAGRTYAVSHLWGPVPIHLVGAHLSLDRRTPGQVGAARTSPHGLVQELLNATDDYLWGIVSNGLLLRILRDNATMTRQAYIEFDLEEMMDGQVFSDFVVLWLITHQSRFEGQQPADSWLERWSKEAQQAGVRALDQLRDGVEQAISVLGRGFIAHPANSGLRERLRSGDLDPQEYYRQLLRLVYRFIFLFVAEARQLLLLPDAPTQAKDLYGRFYSVGRLRNLADQRRGASPHGDLWRVIGLVTKSLGSDSGCPQLGLPALGGFLWASESTGAFEGSELANRELLRAIAALAFVTEGRVRRQVDYRNLGPEELGSVYESLLERHPRINLDLGSFELATVSGNERKTTGSYYTPTSLIGSLLDSALDPVLDEATRQAGAEAAILAMRIVDPACGSGHFLIAAAHRTARRLASVRSGDEEPSPEQVRHALRDVIGHCVYGVDVNPMAVELCKVSLWIEAIDPGRPLSFLDQHIQVGHSLIGATLELLAAGIPDDAYNPIEGDNKPYAASLKKRNKSEREGQTSFLFGEEEASSLRAPLVKGLATLDGLGDESIVQLREKERRYSAFIASPEAKRAKLAADTWCSAFVSPKRPEEPTITAELCRRMAADPNGVPARMRERIQELASKYHFFHWELAFASVFHGGGGFDVVVGNPPWERVKLQEQEFFAVRDPNIAFATGAKRKELIARLPETDPALGREFKEEANRSESVSHFLRASGRFPLCGRGDINTYSVFAEGMRSLIAPAGRAGIIVPTGIATEDTTKDFFAALVEDRSLVCLFDFENREKLFPEVHSGMKFCLLTMAGPQRPVSHAEFVFFAHRVEDLADEDRRFRLVAEDFRLLNPNTRTCPIFRTRRDAEITTRIYDRVPVLMNRTVDAGNPWAISFLRMFDMTNDSELFRTRAELVADGWELNGNIFRRDTEAYLPLYEGKMFQSLDHRAADIVTSATALIRQGQSVEFSEVDHINVSRLPIPRMWVAQHDVAARLRKAGELSSLLVFRNVTSPTNERTIVTCLLPVVAVGHSAPILLTANGSSFIQLVSSLSSFVVDFVARCKINGINLTFFIVEQLPILPPAFFVGPAPWDLSTTVEQWISPRIAELSCTASDMTPLARKLGFLEAPFTWDDSRREVMRAELDAAFFHLYGLNREDAAYVLDTFPIVKRADERAHGEYRTKRLILERFDALGAATTTGISYETVLKPLPAHVGLIAGSL